MSWNPRGAQTWPEWRKAVPGKTRVEHTLGGMRGTFAKWPKTRPGKAPGYAVINWDSGKRGRVVAYAWDLRTVEKERS